MLLEELLKSIIAEKRQLGVPKAVILNYLKEYIQYLVLSLIYNHSEFKKLVFKPLSSTLSKLYLLIKDRFSV